MALASLYYTIFSSSDACFQSPHYHSHFFYFNKSIRPISHSYSYKDLCSKRFCSAIALEGSKDASVKELPLGLDASIEDEYESQSKLLKNFTSICNIDKAWTFKSDNGKDSKAMFLVSQADLLANKRRQFMLSSSISKESNSSVKFQWAPFPVEVTGVSAFVPSPSGSKILVVRNPDNKSPTRFEIWSQSQLEKEFHIPHSVHGSVYIEGWFEGISWNSDETLIAYVAEEAAPPKPTFDDQGYKKGVSVNKECSSWKGQGEWQEHWGERCAGKQQPVIFVISINSGEVQPVKGIPKSLSVGQVVWAPLSEDMHQYLVFTGWLAEGRKLGMRICYNRPCGLYAVKAPVFKSEANDSRLKDDVNSTEDSHVHSLTESRSSSCFAKFSPDGRFLVYLHSNNAVDTGAHHATESLHRIDWLSDLKQCSSANAVEVIPVVQCPGDDGFPGLYCSNLHRSYWLSDGCTLILSSIWGSRQVLISVNVLSGKVKIITPNDSDSSWNLLALDQDNVIAVSSSPVDVPGIQFGCLLDDAAWNWLSISSPLFKCSEKVKSLLSARQFSIVKIPVSIASDSDTTGARKPFEAIFVSSKCNKKNECDSLIVMLHGGPHSIATSSFSKSLAFFSSLGYSLLIVNYRGSIGFGEEALQSLPGNVGTQDVRDALAAVNHIIEIGLASSSRIALLGSSHGGFLVTHLIGQAPGKFAAAAVKNPVCNLASMVTTTDIPDWCHVLAFGSDGKTRYTEAPSAEDLKVFHKKSPIAHISKAKTPTIFLLGAQDLRVPMSNGLQYARALKEKGIETKILIFPSDGHSINRPQTDFECCLEIGVWFKKYCQ